MKARIAKKILTRQDDYRDAQVARARRATFRRKKWQPKIRFRSLRLPRFKIRRNLDGLSKYSMPITNIIEENKLSDMIGIDERAWFDFSYTPVPARGHETLVMEDA